MHEWNFVESKNKGKKPEKKLESVKIRIYEEKPRLKMAFKNSSLEHGQLKYGVPFWWFNICTIPSFFH
jgi:hypothetical protein